MVTLAQYRRHALASALLGAVRSIDLAGVVQGLGASPDAVAARNAIETLRALAQKYLL